MSGGSYIDVRRRDELLRLVLAFAVVVALGLVGAAFGRAVAVQTSGSSGSSSSGGGGGTTTGGGNDGSSSSNTESDGSSSSNGDDGSSSSSTDDGSSSSNGDDGSSSSSTDDGDGGVDGGATPGGVAPTETTAPSGTATTLAPTASTIPEDLPDDVPPARDTTCPDDVASSSEGGRVRCYKVDPDDLDGLDEVVEVGIPGFPLPVALPVPVPIPVGSDTGDSSSTNDDHSVTVAIDIDNRTVVDGVADEIGRFGQRVLATLALLVLVPTWALVLVALTRMLRSSGGPTAGGPAPPPPSGRWVWEQDDS